MIYDIVLKYKNSLNFEEEYEKFNNRISKDVVYSSNYVRAMQTAKYFAEKHNLKLNIDERFNERKLGNANIEKYPNGFTMQYWDKKFKASGGESQEEVNKRMTEAFWDAVQQSKGKKIVVVSHGTFIFFY